MAPNDRQKETERLIGAQMRNAGGVIQSRIRIFCGVRGFFCPRYTSRGSFFTNRTGVVVLHSLGASRGRPAVVTHPDSSAENLAFRSSCRRSSRSSMSPPCPTGRLPGTESGLSSPARFSRSRTSATGLMRPQNLFPAPHGYRFPTAANPERTGPVGAQRVGGAIISFSFRCAGRAHDGPPLANAADGTSLPSGSLSSKAGEAVAELLLNFNRSGPVQGRYPPRLCEEH